MGVGEGDTLSVVTMKVAGWVQRTLCEVDVLVCTRWEAFAATRRMSYWRP